MSRRRIVVAHPSPDLYGSDRQLLVTIEGLIADGFAVHVVLPLDGPLVELMRVAGADVTVEEFPVLRKSVLSPRGLATFALSMGAASLRLSRGLRRDDARAVFVNTVTIPVWLVAAKLSGVPSVCHVHEAEEDQPHLVRLGIAAQLLLTQVLVVNSHAARRALVAVLPVLDKKLTVVHNGVGGPGRELRSRRSPSRDSASIALIARLSPRKGIDVALEAVGLLRSQGRDVNLTICGTAYEGYEWYEAELRARSKKPDLTGAIDFRGYVNPTWPVLEHSDLVVVPSRVEPFGNTAVEAMLARRPVVASKVQGLQEVVTDRETGLLVAPGDPQDLASAIALLLDDPALADRLSRSAETDAIKRFSIQRYQRDVGALVAGVARAR